MTFVFLKIEVSLVIGAWNLEFLVPAPSLLNRDGDPIRLAVVDR